MAIVREYPLFIQDDKDHLYRHFLLEEHEVRIMYTAGKEVPHGWKKRNDSKPLMVSEWAIWSTYIKRDAVINRLNERFFGEWSSGFLSSENPYQYHKDHVDCAMHMTIRGVRMEYNGSQSGTGENGAKGAATDAFKRVASQWGIGLYLQHAPVIMTKNPEQFADRSQRDQMESEAIQKMETWINQLSIQASRSQQPPSNVSDMPQRNDDEQKEFVSQPTSIYRTIATANGSHLHTISGASMWSREPLRELGFFIPEESKPGEYDLGENITAIYIQKGKYRNIVRIRRDSTGEVAHVQANLAATG